MNCTIFESKIFDIKCVFRFYIQLLSETFLIIIRIERDVYCNVHWSSSMYPLFLSDFNETNFSRQIFQKYSNIKFHENPSSGSRVVPYGQTDRPDEAKTAVFRNFANAPKNSYFVGAVMLY